MMRIHTLRHAEVGDCPEAPAPCSLDRAAKGKRENKEKKVQNKEILKRFDFYSQQAKKQFLIKISLINNYQGKTKKKKNIII